MKISDLKVTFLILSKIKTPFWERGRFPTISVSRATLPLPAGFHRESTNILADQKVMSRGVFSLVVYQRSPYFHCFNFKKLFIL
jgi:hypothetical protein